MIFINFVIAFIFLLTNLHFILAALPVQSACGIQTNQPSILGPTLNRVINGANSNANSWPWVVSLRQYRPSTNQISSHFCGATLIYEDLVLTAAHCVRSLDAANIAVVIGVQNIESETATTANTYFVSDRYYNDAYNDDKLSSGNDIAILKLAKSVTLSTKIALACLPNSSADATTVYTKNTVATGWGSTTGERTTAALSSELQQTTLTVMNGVGVCTTQSYDSGLLYCMIDSTATSTPSNICYGDSGGSIVYYANAKWYVYGITSYVIAFGNGNCDNSVPSYFTQVPKYLAWIEYGLAFIASGQVQPSGANENVRSNWLLSMSFVLVVLMK